MKHRAHNYKYLIFTKPNKLACFLNYKISPLSVFFTLKIIAANHVSNKNFLITYTCKVVSNKLERSSLRDSNAPACYFLPSKAAFNEN
jgi:hypothetical protein